MLTQGNEIGTLKQSNNSQVKAFRRAQEKDCFKHHKLVKIVDPVAGLQ